jgi:hypothetical protein
MHAVTDDPTNLHVQNKQLNIITLLGKLQSYGKDKTQ